MTHCAPIDPGCPACTLERLLRLWQARPAGVDRAELDRHIRAAKEGEGLAAALAYLDRTEEADGDD